MSLRFILLVTACVQLALANPSGSSQWQTLGAPSRNAWNVPAAYTASPSWSNDPAGPSSNEAAAPWKTPAPTAGLSFAPVNVGVEHPWAAPALAPASVSTGSPAIATPVESNWNGWTGQNTHSWNVPANPGSNAAAAAEHREPQLPAPLRLPSPPKLPAPRQLPPRPQLPAPLQLPAPAHIPSSAKVSASSHSSNHPLQNHGSIKAVYGPGLPPYAPLKVPYHPLQNPGSILTAFGPGLAPYALLQVSHYPLQNPGSFQPSFGPGLTPYALLQVPHTPSGPQYGPGIAPYAAILVPSYTH